MPDDLNNQAAGEGADNNANAGEGADDANKKSSTDAGAEGQDSEGKEGGGEGKEKKPEAKAPISPEGEDDEPATKPRLSAKDFIIGRHHKKLSKLAKTNTEAGEGGDDKTGEGDDGEVAPEDEALIGKVIRKELSPILEPILQSSLTASDNTEVAEFLKENPDFAKYEAKAKKYMAHPSRRHLPIQTIFFEVAGNDLIKIGAERQKEADRKANDTQTGGGGSRHQEGARSAWDMTPEEFEQEKEKVRQGK